MYINNNKWLKGFSRPEVEKSIYAFEKSNTNIESIKDNLFFENLLA